MADTTPHQAQAIVVFRKRFVTRGTWMFGILSFLLCYTLVREEFQIADFSVWLMFLPIFLGAGYVWAVCMWRFFVSQRLNIQIQPARSNDA